MKKHTLFILVILQVFVFAFAFADQTLNSNLQLDAMRVKSIVNELQNQLKTNTSDLQLEIINKVFEIKNQHTPIIFVTGFRGDYHSVDSNVPLTITHSVVQPNDEVFSGKLTYYYMRVGYINPSLPYGQYYQAFYEGTLNSVGYVN